MRRRAGKHVALAAVVVLLSGALGTVPAVAEFGVKDLDLVFTNQDPTSAGSITPATQAGSHPFALTLAFHLNSTFHGLAEFPDDEIKEAVFYLPPGVVGDPEAVPHCSNADFLNIVDAKNACPDRAAVGFVVIRTGWSGFPGFETYPAYSLPPAPGVPARLGFTAVSVPVVTEVGINQEPPYNLVAALRSAPQVKSFYGARLTLWGNPSDPVHDPYRGRCLEDTFTSEPGSSGSCPAALSSEPLFTLPSNCDGPAMTTATVESWQNPGKLASASVLTHDNAEPPSPQGFTGCGKLGFSPRIESQTTTDSAEAGTGLDFNVDFNDEGLSSPTGLAESTARKAVVTLPAGVTINPSVGEGLGVCTPTDLKRETLAAAPGEGCPNSSKVGSLRLETPLVDEAIEGAVFLAQQDDSATKTSGAENPFDSLIALYFVLKSPNLGLITKRPVRVEPDPSTGQLVVTLDDVPQLPFSHFNFHFREGARAVLITPPACGTFTTRAVFTPWSDPSNPRTVFSSFQITRGVGGGPCPSGGIPPFHPGFQAGAINNNAGSFSPFNMRLIRTDGEQDMTKFSAILPRGELGSLAGVSKCPDSAIAIAKAKTGRQERASPSCPPNSLIGRTLAGAGVGSALTYVGGRVYLGGPYEGDPLSVISVTPAVAGPFDAGTVVIRLALTLNPRTAEVEVDGAASDPIPHILKGIVLKMRDLRVYVDRPNFTLNPTSCDELSTKARLFGSFLNVFDPSDDAPVNLAARYQAANCLNLGYKPRFSLRLEGSTGRGGHPGLRAIFRPRSGNANAKGLVVRLPRSAFLDQAHIRTICTRVQFVADDCPIRARYGYIRAWTPLLDEPLEGPAYLRSSNHKLPDLVFNLHGLVDIEVAARIDSAAGGVRATIGSIPDAPLSRVVLLMQGGKKGLIVNSRNLCAGKSRASVDFRGQNGKQHHINPVLRAGCGKGRRHKRLHKAAASGW